MNGPAALFESSLSNLNLRARGKVRDIYDIDDQHLLIVTTDRLSAFDVVLPDPIPGKGRVLTSVSNFWFNKMQDIIPNHLASLSLEEIVPDATELPFPRLIKGWSRQKIYFHHEHLPLL
jgi:phosphoribosylaminoimidazole-succinocarboxamide synthase